MKNPFGGDALLDTLKGPLLKIIEPAFAEARQEILNKLAGPTPNSFKTRLAVLYGFTPTEVDAIWQAAVDSAAMRRTKTVQFEE